MVKPGKTARQQKPPAHLTLESRKFWKWAVAEFVLEQHDLKLLQLACEALDTAAACRAQLALEGRTYLDVRGKPKAHPAVNMHRDATATVAKCLRELRLSEVAEESRPPRTGGRKW